MSQSYPFRFASCTIALTTLTSTATLPQPSIAQITPDASLGLESSIVTPNVEVNGALGDTRSAQEIQRIEGGAIRNSHLFHSFSDFNIDSDQRVYFDNPAAIDNIITRVTGDTQSNILGTLGVLGDADLFLINPNGIVFGPNAALDIGGSFLGSTSDQILFDSGYAFSATTPDAPPLLTVPDTIVGLENWLPQSGTIQSSGNLTVGGDLGLAAQALTLQNTVTAGGNMHLLGNNAITVDGQFNAGGNMQLISNSLVQVGGNFQAGGNIQIEDLEGDSGALQGIDGTRFETAGDFSANSYSGPSLTILAGGSVAINQSVDITAGSNGLNAETNPTVDIRAGVTQFSGVLELNNPTRADIAIGPITNPGGLVTLSNRVQNNRELSGNITVDQVNTVASIGGGNVNINSRGRLTFQAINTSSMQVATTTHDPPNFSGAAGDVFLRANRTIEVRSSEQANDLFRTPAIASNGTEGGNITIESGTNIRQPFGADILSTSTDGRLAGDISLSARAIFLGDSTFRATIRTKNYGDAAGGNIIIVATHRLRTKFANILTQSFGSSDSGDIRISVEGGPIVLEATNLVTELNSLTSSGDILRRSAGDTHVEADTIQLIPSSSLSSQTSGIRSQLAARALGSTGNIDITAHDFISLHGSSEIASRLSENNRGNAGHIRIITDHLNLYSSSKISSAITSDGTGPFDSLGSAGDIYINANAGEVSLRDAVIENSSEANVGTISITADTVSLSNASRISSSTEQTSGLSFSDPTGRVIIRAQRLEVLGGSQISAKRDINQGSSGDDNNNLGGAGQIRIIAHESVSIRGSGMVGNNVAPSRITTLVSSLQGDVIASNAELADLSNNRNEDISIGNITIKTRTLEVTNGGRITASAQDGDVNAGSIRIVATRSALFDGHNRSITTEKDDSSQAAVFVNQTYDFIPIGDAGDIIIRTPELSLMREGRLAAANEGSGEGGDIRIFPLDGRARDGNTVNIYDGSLLADSIGQGGRIEIEGDRIFLDNAKITAITQSPDDADGGSIRLDASDLLTMFNNSFLSASAGDGSPGDGGNITIQTPFIVTDSQGDNDIVANAFDGAGGRITIDGEGIVGLLTVGRSRRERLPDDQDGDDPVPFATNDISAISLTNSDLDGDVVLGAPDVTDSGSIQLPTALIAAPPLSSLCSPTHSGRSEFIQRGRGGLPTDPTDALNGSQVSVPWVTRSTSNTPNTSNTSNTTVTSTAPHLSTTTTHPPTTITEAQGWTTATDGTVTLLATPAQAQPQLPSQHPQGVCHSQLDG